MGGSLDPDQAPPELAPVLRALSEGAGGADGLAAMLSGDGGGGIGGVGGGWGAGVDSIGDGGGGPSGSQPPILFSLCSSVSSSHRHHCFPCSHHVNSAMEPRANQSPST